MTDVGTQLLDVPFGDMVRSLALAIADAQFELDRTGVRLAQMMSGQPFPTGALDENDQPEIHPGLKIDFGKDEKLSMLELGFTPSFYQFVDTIIEVKISINISREVKASTTHTRKSLSASGGFFLFGGGVRTTATSVSASYASKYNYSAEGSSLIRTKLAPVPPPAILEERIRGLIATPPKSKEDQDDGEEGQDDGDEGQTGG